MICLNGKFEGTALQEYDNNLPSNGNEFNM